MTSYDDDELKEWADTIWASVEYRGNGLKSIKEFITWLNVERKPDIGEGWH